MITSHRRKLSREFYPAVRALEDASAAVRAPGPYARRRVRRAAWRQIWNGWRRVTR